MTDPNPSAADSEIEIPLGSVAHDSRPDLIPPDMRLERVDPVIADRDATGPADTATSGAAQDARKPFRFTLKLLLFAAVIYYFVVPMLPDFQNALDEVQRVEPSLLVIGLLLELMALYCYAPLMKAALGDAGHDISRGRLFRIQMSTRALSSIVPGGSAASSALGYRLLTLSGVAGPDAGFALATVGLGSAVVLNMILWLALIVSIPVRGVNPLYGSAALAGIIVMLIAAMLVWGLMDGQGRSERAIRWLAKRMRLNPDKAALILGRVAERLEQLMSDRRLLASVAFWAALNWIFDAAALWVFLRAFGITMDADGLFISFGIANVLAALPITPGGLGYVDASYVTMLTGFGAPARRATLGVAGYRFAQFFFPILLGGMLYLSLRVGPWSIERRDRLQRLRDIAEEETRRGESKIDFQMRFPTRDDTGELIRRPPSGKDGVDAHQERFRRWRRGRPQ